MFQNVKHEPNEQQFEDVNVEGRNINEYEEINPNTNMPRPRVKYNPQNVVTLVQCYYCSEMFLKSGIEFHMRSQHGRFLSAMFGPKRPYR